MALMSFIIYCNVRVGSAVQKMIEYVLYGEALKCLVAR